MPHQTLATCDGCRFDQNLYAGLRLPVLRDSRQNPFSNMDGTGAPQLSADLHQLGRLEAFQPRRALPDSGRIRVVDQPNAIRLGLR